MKLLPILIAGLLVSPLAARAATFKWANDGDSNSMDPYTRSETFLLSFDANMYEPLVRRDRDLKLEPALATAWEQPTPTTWRFHLRSGVKFTGGEPFTADDVVFSYERASTPGSNLQAYFQAVKAMRKVDDLTIDVETKFPDPIFPQEITSWGIMSKIWCTQHDAVHAADLSKKEENYATRNADGTGPFILKTREHRPPHQPRQQSGLVGQAAAQPDRRRVLRHLQRRHACRRPALRRCRHDLHGSRRRTWIASAIPTACGCSRRPSCAPSFSAWTSRATNS